MQPEQQTVQPDYDFIMNSQQKKRALNFSGGSPATRILVVVVGFFVLIIFIVIVKSILSGTPPATSNYFSLLQEQSEIIHIMNNDLQNQNATISSANQAFSQTALLTMTSYQTALVSYMGKIGIKVSKSSLNVSSAKVDADFAAAVSSDDFNSIFQNVMSSELTAYNSNLIQAYSNTAGAVGKNLIQSQYKGTQLLIRELNNQYS